MKGDERRETRDERERSLETGDWRWETEDGRPEPGDGKWEMGDVRQVTGCIGVARRPPPVKVGNSRHIFATSPDNESFVKQNFLTLTM